MTQAATRAYSYLRFSTPEQEKGDSHRRQTDLANAYSEKHGLFLDEKLTYRDLGVSAFDKSNVRSGQLGAFLEAIKLGTVQPGSFLLVESLDRLSRAHISDALIVFMSIINAGITIVTLGDQKEYSKASINNQFTDLIVSITIMSRAHEESATKSKRLKEVWNHKRKNTETKKLTSLCPGWLMLSDDRSHYVEIPERVKVVREMFESSINGIGMGSITKRLNQRIEPTFGVNNKLGTWHQSYITKILSNRAVLGEFQPHILSGGVRIPEGEPIKDYFPQIIPETDFAACISARKSRKRTGAGRKGVTYSNIFSGLLRCGYCGSSMTYLDKGHNGPRAKLLVCAGAKGGKDCFYVPWEYDQFEASVLTFCKSIDFEQFNNLNTKAKSELSTLTDKVALLTESLAQLEEKQINILKAIEDGGDFSFLKERAKFLANEHSQISAELKVASDRYQVRVESKVDFNMVRASITDLLTKMAMLEGDAKYDLRALLSQQVKRGVSRISMYPGGQIEPKKFLKKLRESLKGNGESASAIESYISTRLQTDPKPEDRFFVMASPTASLRRVKPDPSEPEVLDMDILGETTKAKAGFAAFAIQEIFESIKANGH